MRLKEFILGNLERILQEWEDFAASLVPAEKSRDKVMLRDHAKKMLEAIAVDLAKLQTRYEEIEKSKGHESPSEVEMTAATIHGKERLESGFSLDATVAEYRALRASVTRLWQKSLLGESISDTSLGDIIRFNEAIDQSITESVVSYSFEKEQQLRIFDTVLSSLPDISFTFSLDGKLSYVNKSLMELFALPVDKLIGKDFFELGLLNGTELQRQIDMVISTKKQFRGEMSYTNPTGQLGFYDYIFVPVLDPEGMVEAVVGTARNITERKAVEDKTGIWLTMTC
jgi:PAS domain S-box-containing protein